MQVSSGVWLSNTPPPAADQWRHRALNIRIDTPHALAFLHIKKLASLETGVDPLPELKQAYSRSLDRLAAATMLDQKNPKYLSYEQHQDKLRKMHEGYQFLYRRYCDPDRLKKRRIKLGLEDDKEDDEEDISHFVDVVETVGGGAKICDGEFSNVLLMLEVMNAGKIKEAAVDNVETRLKSWGGREKTDASAKSEPSGTEKESFMKKVAKKKDSNSKVVNIGSLMHEGRTTKSNAFSTDALDWSEIQVVTEKPTQRKGKKVEIAGQEAVIAKSKEEVNTETATDVPVDVHALIEEKKQKKKRERKEAQKDAVKALKEGGKKESRRRFSKAQEYTYEDLEPGKQMDNVREWLQASPNPDGIPRRTDAHNQPLPDKQHWTDKLQEKLHS